jgi:hypothetical protein
MSRILVLGIYLILFSSAIAGQSLELNPAAYGSGPFVAADQSKYALWRNVAGIANTNSWNLLLAYQYPYDLPEIQSFAIGIIIPWKPGIGLSMLQSGTTPLINQQIAINTAVELNEVKIGVRVKYWHLEFSGNNLLNAITAGIGIQAELNSQIVAGIYIDNVTQTHIGQQESIPVLWYTGIKYQPAPHLTLNIETGYVMEQEWQVKMGVEYIIKNRFVARTGFNASNLESFFGLGFLIEPLEIDYALSIHPSLGITHQGAGSYSQP